MLASLRWLALCCLPLRSAISQCAVGPAAFLGRSGVWTFLPLEGEYDNTHGMSMQAAEEFISSHTPLAALQVKHDFSFRDW